MIKLTKTYFDFDNNERTEDFYFNLNPAEVYEMQNSVGGGLGQLLEKIAKEHDQTKLIEFFKKLVLTSYGEKSLDGRTLMKDDTIRKTFECTMAYSEIFMDLATDAKQASDFVNGIMPPKDVMEKYIKRIEANNKPAEVVSINK